MNNREVFTKEYSPESTTEAEDKKTELVIQEKTLLPNESGTRSVDISNAEKTQNQTGTGGISYYDKSKPYRIKIKAKEIKK